MPRKTAASTTTMPAPAAYTAIGFFLSPLATLPKVVKACSVRSPEAVSPSLALFSDGVSCATKSASESDAFACGSGGASAATAAGVVDAAVAFDAGGGL